LAVLIVASTVSATSVVSTGVASTFSSGRDFISSTASLAFLALFSCVVLDMDLFNF